MKTGCLDEIRKRLAYDPGTGVFTHLISTRAGPAGSRAGAVHPNGYVRIQVCGVRYPAAHRLAWAMHYGVWPTLHIDHINGDKADNRIVNLREVTHSQNHMNRHDYGENRGVSWHNQNKNWRARIKVDGKQIHIGSFKTQDEARAAYAKAAKKLFGDFAPP